MARNLRGHVQMKERVVFEVVVKTKHIYSDIFQWARNVLGKRLPGYENMITDAIQTALDNLYKKHPKVYDVHITQCEVTQGAAEIIVYGKVRA